MKKKLVDLYMFESYHYIAFGRPKTSTFFKNGKIYRVDSN